jgi:3-hydroxyisobutyrate dehydrogenase-like beta-hydroxyacid dehydrogenase
VTFCSKRELAATDVARRPDALTMHVGIAGTGKMGSAIAHNLLERGYRIAAWNVDPAMMASLVEAGAIPCEDLATLVASVEAVIAMLWDDGVAREISLGRIIPAARRGQLVIECTTLSPQMYEELAHAAGDRGVHFLACPVIGSVDGARTGALSLFPGGSTEAFDHGRELLNAIGSSVRFTGSATASGHLKLASNCMLAVLAGSIGELLATMRRAGVDRVLAVDTLVYMLQRVASKHQQLMERDTRARFSASALVKDLRLASAARESLRVNAPLTDLASAEFERAVELGLGDEDYIAVGLAIERAQSALDRDIGSNDELAGAGRTTRSP